MTKTAIAAPPEDRDPRPLYVLVLEDAIRQAIQMLKWNTGEAEIIRVLEEALDVRAR